VEVSESVFQKILTKFVGFLAVFTLLLFFGGEGQATSEPFDAFWSSRIQESISRKELPLPLPLLKRTDFHPLVSSFYEELAFGPVWFDENGLSRQAGSMIAHLRSLSDEGLCPEDYRLAELEEMFLMRHGAASAGRLPDHRWWVGIDLLLTDAFLSLADDLLSGRVDPLEVHEEWSFAKNLVTPAEALRSVLDGREVAEVFWALRPYSSAYGKLVEALWKYREIAAGGGWPLIPDGPLLRRGGKDSRVSLLKSRLSTTGDLPAPNSVSDDLLDDSLWRGLIHFQKRHGLAPDGVLGPQTLSALNIDVYRRIRQIEVNLERWRWLPRDLGERYLQVNIPDMTLAVMEGGQPVLWMPVVVGRAVRETPVFSARMTYIEFSPYWHVPPTILREDKLPKIQKDPQWLARNNFDLVSYANGRENILDPQSIDWQRIRAENFPGVLRQRPGPWNPLGRIKFMFPNAHAIYLHDTNEPWLFYRNRRLFSSGCIRIQRPLDLAQYLLEKDGWSCDDLLQAMNLDRPRTVSLARPLPVYLLYMTAWVDSEGLVQFRKDPYQKDLALDYLLSQRSGFCEISN